MWRRVVAYFRQGVQLVHNDYATTDGYTIRFGDGEFGTTPVDGTLFDVVYRPGAGSRANLSADIITALCLPQGEADPKDLSELGFIKTVTNRFAVTNGPDPESAEAIKQLTPEAYQSETLFAVRPDDYGRQSEKLDWVQRAHGSFCWTGSRHSVIVSADPLNAHPDRPRRQQPAAPRTRHFEADNPAVIRNRTDDCIASNTSDKHQTRFVGATMVSGYRCSSIGSIRRRHR